MLKNKTKRRPRRLPHRPSLRFSPYAWAKLLYLRDRGDTEIGGFGLSAAANPLLLIDILLIKQRCSVVTVAFDDGAVADLFDDLVDQGLKPEQFGRVWLHTHPGDCPLPSSTDEATFRRVFGRTDWSIMAIVARNDTAYARLSFRVGPGGALELPVGVDYGPPFEGADPEAWEQAYLDNVIVEHRTAAKPAELWAGPFAEDHQHSFMDWEDIYGGTASAGSVRSPGGVGTAGTDPT